MNNESSLEETELQQSNKGAEGLFASVYLLERLDCEVSFNMPCEQRLMVRRDGITYSVKQIGRYGSPYRYAIGTRIDGEFLTTRYPNAYDSFVDAVNAIRQMILHDPRQTGIPAHERASHFSLTISVGE